MLSADLAADVIARLGIPVAATALEVERREHRWLVRLPDDRIAWIAADERGSTLLERERRTLRLLCGRVPFEVPVVIAEATDGTADVRTLVPGRVDPWWVHDRVVADASFASLLGRELGAALAAIHALVPDPAKVAQLPVEPDWPTQPAHIRERLHHVVDDPLIHDGAALVLGMFADASARLQPHERVLCHGDLGFHNMVLTPDDNSLRGIFDWESTCWTDPHVDFRYLLADLNHTALFNAATASYESAGGVTIAHDRVLLYNAVWAISFLAYRAGVSPETRWCGRTLAEDLAWTRRAFAHLRA